MREDYTRLRRITSASVPIDIQRSLRRYPADLTTINYIKLEMTLYRSIKDLVLSDCAINALKESLFMRLRCLLQGLEIESI